MPAEQTDFTAQFIDFAIKKEVLRFGEFKTKAGRLSPYFFNAGLFNDGERYEGRDKVCGGVDRFRARHGKTA